MALYESARAAHIALGVLVLLSFWGAAAVRKGSRARRRWGRAYLLGRQAVR